MPVIADTHAHLFDPRFDDDREEVLARAREAGVSRMLVVGTSAATSRAAFELCRGRAGLHPSAGIHPHDCAQAAEADRSEVERLARETACLAVGETGLDFFRDLSPREEQRRNFRWHLALARELGKPVVVHGRDAHEDTVALLREFPGVRGVMHCYTLGPAELPPYLELDLYVSFSGVVTFPRNDENRAAARAVPPDRLLIETDCPYLAPQSRRGRRNEPALVREVLECVARERGESQDELARTTSANAARLFGW